MEQNQLGLTADQYAAVCNGADVVVHCAALVSWDERLDRSMNANTLGPPPLTITFQFITLTLPLTLPLTHP